MPDGPVFDLDRSTQQAWEGFIGRLDEVLSMMDDESDLTISTLSSGLDPLPAIRFTGLPGPRVLAEALGSAPGAQRAGLSEGQREALEKLGWKAPAEDEAHAARDLWRAAESDHTKPLAEACVVALRNVYGVEHPVFLVPDQLAELLHPPRAEAQPGAHTPADTLAVFPRDQAHLDELIDAELVALYGHYPFRDSEGDVAIRVGSTVVFIRSTPDAREVVLFSALVHDVAGRSRAAEVLNDLNVESRFGRFALHKDRVFVQMSVPAQPFAAAHLHQGLKTISQIADGIDDELAARLRGRTTFDTASD